MNKGKQLISFRDLHKQIYNDGPTTLGFFRYILPKEIFNDPYAPFEIGDDTRLSKFFTDSRGEHCRKFRNRIIDLLTLNSCIDVMDFINKSYDFIKEENIGEYKIRKAAKTFSKELEICPTLKTYIEQETPFYWHVLGLLVLFALVRDEAEEAFGLSKLQETIICKEIVQKFLESTEVNVNYRKYLLEEKESDWNTTLIKYSEIFESLVEIIDEQRASERRKEHFIKFSRDTIHRY